VEPHAKLAAILDSCNDVVQTVWTWARPEKAHTTHRELGSRSQDGTLETYCTAVNPVEAVERIGSFRGTNEQRDEAGEHQEHQDAPQHYPETRQQRLSAAEAMVDPAVVERVMSHGVVKT
jgi:hypothetical protein